MLCYFLAEIISVALQQRGEMWKPVIHKDFRSAYIWFLFNFQWFPPVHTHTHTLPPPHPPRVFLCLSGSGLFSISPFLFSLYWMYLLYWWFSCLIFASLFFLEAETCPEPQFFYCYSNGLTEILSFWLNVFCPAAIYFSAPLHLELCCGHKHPWGTPFWQIRLSGTE